MVPHKDKRDGRNPLNLLAGIKSFGCTIKPLTVSISELGLYSNVRYTILHEFKSCCYLL